MDGDLLKEILSIPTYYGREERIKDFIRDFAIRNGVTVIYDVKGNVYLKKGELDEGEKYPCVVAHLDTVHKSHVDLIDNNERLKIHEEKTKEGTKLMAFYDGEQTGVGGDDKAGIYICLQLLLRNDKIMVAFFVEEEFGCLGSKNVDKEILKDVGYFIQFDAPHDNWCSVTSKGVQLFSKEVFSKIKGVFEKHMVFNMSYDPYTDIFRLKETFDVACMNFFAGYYRMHSTTEYVIVEHVNKAINFAHDIIAKLGNEEQPMKHKRRVDEGLIEDINEWGKNLLTY